MLLIAVSNQRAPPVIEENTGSKCNLNLKAVVLNLMFSQLIGAATSNVHKTLETTTHLEDCFKGPQNMA